ncbi:periplasmic nitrate reductase, NapE protein [Halomonas campisalis]|uniref:Periplasmic nitrate reductase, NapE protein n=1 Tax=Billgrantia campisalis TaxID=74661 RepID=A0ABS9P691_9GAMM|nr:periplasmic nitrate reductase, NapE protein [Halomonas campisalis]MCG6657290.1 periplasmic nitrate reductase, NapE protein [Halomonas campisalis]MDR5864168.1 periplasmic nitrate reductase, NapE protein [Halomonas campisalis]
MEEPETMAPETRKKQELKLFLFIAVLLFPLLAIAVVGGFGFAVWIYQMFAGPPGPPS